MSSASFSLAIMAMAYGGVNVVLFVLNYLSEDECDEPDDLRVARCGSAVSELFFHRLEFSATACYSERAPTPTPSSPFSPLSARTNISHHHPTSPAPHSCGRGAVAAQHAKEPLRHLRKTKNLRAVPLHQCDGDLCHRCVPGGVFGLEHSEAWSRHAVLHYV